MMKYFNMSIGERMIETAGKASGFDYLRLVLAVLVVLSHSFSSTMNEVERDAFIHSIYLRPFHVILPMFFALSGFLVAGSFERSATYKEFYALRILRIVPALAMETLISAVVLGAIFTTLPLMDYYQDPLFHRYFFNIIGHIQYELPGVFLNNPHPRVVNSQLWTIPYELYCYISLGLIGVLGIFSRRKVLLIVTIICAAMVLLGVAKGVRLAYGLELVLDFLLGILVYRFRDVIPWDHRIAAVLALFVVVVVLQRGGIHLCIVPLAYLTVYLGLLSPPKIKIILGGDYSYGIYLYGFAIQQAVASLGAWTHHWLINFALALPCAVLCAVFSWTYVEKPTLKLRRFIRRPPRVVAPADPAVVPATVAEARAERGA